AGLLIRVCRSFRWVFSLIHKIQLDRGEAGQNMTSLSESTTPTFRTLVPARLDRLPWTRFHWRVILGLGAAWILDGLEIQIVATVGTVLQDKATLHLTAANVGLLGSVYLLGEVVGALFFGWLTDRLGRRRLFLVTLITYLAAAGSAGSSRNSCFLRCSRCFRGPGVAAAPPR